MITTNFLVKKRKISQLDSVPYTGEFNIDKFKFQFDEEWAGLNKTLVIVADNTYNVALLNDECLVPQEFYDKKGNIMIGVFGSNGNQKILATGWLPIYVEDDSYTGEEPSNLPTLTQWDLYISEINRLLSACEATVVECNDILLQLQNDYSTYLEEFNQIKSDTKSYKDEASAILDNVQEVKQDIIDMGASRTFAVFDIDDNGYLYMYNFESLANMGFGIDEDGNLYVETREVERSE